MRNRNFILYILGIGTAWLVGSYINKEDKEVADETYKHIIDNIGPNGYSEYRSPDSPMIKESIALDSFYNKVNKQKSIEISETLSDEEIRILREKNSYRIDGAYIYTPGRIVPTREQEIRNYIDKHGEDIYEELEDKYGN